MFKGRDETIGNEADWLVIDGSFKNMTGTRVLISGEAIVRGTGVIRDTGEGAPTIVSARLEGKISVEGPVLLTPDSDISPYLISEHGEENEVHAGPGI